jgi:hypothetical protein
MTYTHGPSWTPERIRCVDRRAGTLQEPTGVPRAWAVRRVMMTYFMSIGVSGATSEVAATVRPIPPAVPRSPRYRAGTSGAAPPPAAFLPTCGSYST